MGKHESGAPDQFIERFMALLKPTIALLLLITLFSCKEEAKKEPAPATKLVKEDSVPSTNPVSSVNNYAPVDVSPMDMSYFPVDYPKIKMANPQAPAPFARVIYSRPHLQRRHFSEILKLDQPWRLGANESTEIQFFKPATIQGKKIAAGRYVLYCIPHTDTWTIVLNSHIDTWGLKQEASKDVQRFEVPVTANQVSLEYFTIVFEKTSTGADLVMAWDDVVTKLPISF